MDTNQNLVFDRKQSSRLVCETISSSGEPYRKTNSFQYGRNIGRVDKVSSLF